MLEEVKHHQSHHFYPNPFQNSQFYGGLESATALFQPQKRRCLNFGERRIEYATEMGGNSHRKAPPPRAGMRRGGGEIVEVEGGHIVRSSGGKDRHSKVCTAKGTRDRRVRLSAHTAIQFYDVQDRLGYDRPSKAVDWLIDKARAAIEELEKLPPWHPNTSPATSSKPEHRIIGASSEDWRVVGGGRGCSVLSQNPNISASFFRAVSPPQFETFQEPIFLEHREQVLFPGISHLGFDEWSEHVPSWSNTGGAAASGGSGGGSLVFSCSPMPAPPENQLFSQRGPLQSSNTPSIRAWMDPEPPIAASDHHQFPFPYSVSGIGFHIPARIQGEEEHDGIPNKPSSASSDSCH